VNNDEEQVANITGGARSDHSSPQPVLETRIDPPSWVKDAADHLYMASSSDEWTSLVKNWLDLEAKLGYSEGKVSA